MDMEQIVETMARALCKELYSQDERPWEMCGPDLQDEFKAEARAALAAALGILFPVTDAMRLVAINTSLPEPGEPPLYEKLWHAMLDIRIAELAVLQGGLLR